MVNLHRSASQPFRRYHRSYTRTDNRGHLRRNQYQPLLTSVYAYDTRYPP